MLTIKCWGSTILIVNSNCLGGGFADAFVAFLRMDSPGVAREWVTAIAKFSEGPIEIEKTDDPSSDILRLNLKVYGRDLYLDFCGPKEIIIQHYDEGLEQRWIITNREWNISGDYGSMEIRLSDGAMVQISKEPESKTVRIHPFSAMP